MTANQCAATSITSKRTNNRGGNWQQQAWNNMQQAPYCSPVFNAMSSSGGKIQPTPHRAFENQNHCFIHGHHAQNDHTSQTCKTPGPNTIQTPPNSTPWADPTPGHTRPSCRRSTAANPAPVLSLSPPKLLRVARCRIPPGLNNR